MRVSVGQSERLPGGFGVGLTKEYIEEPAGEERWGIWWVKVKTADGVTGWTKDYEHFGNIDGCA